MSEGARDLLACLDCLRRSWLLADLGPFIEVACDNRPGRRTPELLALGDEELVAAMAPSRAGHMLAANRSLGADDLHSELLAARCWAICMHDPTFPESLRGDRDGPRCLIGRGDRSLLNRPGLEGSVTVIGSRRPTREGLAQARILGRDLAGSALSVVSGLALGIDGSAHRGALEAGGPGRTIAVLGCGPDRAYPLRHRALYDEITNHGLVISEMPPGTRPWRWTFPARNRVMAALSAVTVVVEARTGSGSLITADLASSSGRDVAAMPGSVTSPLADGTNSLIRDGAALVRDAADVLEVLGLTGSALRQTSPTAGLDPLTSGVFEAIAIGRNSVDPIAEATSLPAGEVLAALTRLEVRGLIEVGPTGEVVAIQSRKPVTGGR